jgi:transcriptional regulator with XRE-family HTH domain
MLPTFKSLIRGRLQVLGISQVELAQRVKLTAETVSRIMTGRHPVPVDSADVWADALDFTGGDDREQFLDVLHLSAAGPRVRALYEREMNARVTAENFRNECQHRIRRARQVLDLMDPDGKLAALTGPDADALAAKVANDDRTGYVPPAEPGEEDDDDGEG